MTLPHPPSVVDRVASPFENVGAILFDAVGTLIDPSPSVAEVYAAAAARQGLYVAVEEVRQRFKDHFRRDEEDDLRGPMVTDEEIEYRRWRRIVGGVLPGLPEPDRAFEELWDHFGRPEAWKTFDDVAPTVQALTESGYSVRVGSNFDGRLRSVLRGHQSLAKLAPSALISSELGFRKPHPSFYQFACQELGLPADRVLCVGDDPENDHAGPRRAGLPAVLVDRSRRYADQTESVANLLALTTLLKG